MRRSTERILTTHAGKLPPPDDLSALMEADEAGRPGDDAFRELLCERVSEIVREQVACGVDVVNDGELGKLGWHLYLPSRLGGFERRPLPTEGWGTAFGTRDRHDFPDFYAAMDAGVPLGFYQHFGGERIGSSRPVITGPISYEGFDDLRDDLENLRAAADAAGAVEAYLPSTAPTKQGANEYYESESACRYALADALREEYEAIAAAGFIVQIDDPWIPADWDAQPFDVDLPQYRRLAEERVEILNHALQGIPEEQVRYHICWGSWHGPHAHDVELRDIVDIVLKVKAQGYSIEAGNGRHEHEWQVWQDVELPEGKILIPGVVSHATNTVEHPDLVSWRLQLFANSVGRENVIAGTDCGLGNRVHPEIAWAKLRTLAEGAARASQVLWN